MRLITTRHGPDALGHLRAVIAGEKHGDPLAPLTVLVPNNYVGIATRRSLATGEAGWIGPGLHGIAGVDFLTVYRLAELVGAPSLAAAQRRPVSTPLIAAAVRRALEDAPGIFAGVAHHPTTERRLVNAHRELSDVDDAALDELASMSRRARDVVRIHRNVREALSTDWYTEQQLVNAATTMVRNDQGTFASFGHVVLYLPERLSLPKAKLLNAVADRTPSTVIAAMTGIVDADATIDRTLESLGLEPVQGFAPAPAPSITLSNVSDADDEARHVVRGIMAAARDGAAFDRMAVFYASRKPYARLLHDHLSAAGIAFNGAAMTTLAESTAGRFLRRLLALADRGYRREDVIALVSGSPVRWRGRAVPGRAWDQISRAAGVVKGPDDWQTRIQVYISDRRSEIERFSTDPETEWRVRRLERQIDLATELGAYVAELRHGLGTFDTAPTWRDRARWCSTMVERSLGDQREWPEEERTATDRIVAVLDRLATLDTVEQHVTTRVFIRTLDMELEGGLGRIGSFGNGVLIGPAWMSSGLELDHVWIVGLSEGTFPSTMRDDSLLPDRERAVLDCLELRRDNVGNEHRHFLAALAAAGPNGAVHLSRPRGDLRQSDERAPSRWLGDVVSERLGRPVPNTEMDTLDAEWATHVPSFAGGILTGQFPPTAQEYDLRSLADHLASHGSVADHRLLTDSRELAAGAAVQDSRSSKNFTRFDGNLTGVDVPSAAGSRPTSASALETWAGCPQQYFMRYLLGVDPLDTPEHRLRIDPATRGSVVHTILERFVSRQIGRAPADGAWSESHQGELHAIATEEFASAEARGLTGDPLYWRRDQVLLLRDLDEFLRADSERRSRGLRPVATELAFGMRGAEPVAIPMPDGGLLPLRGSIDLVDEDERGNLVVTDYKTGKLVSMTADNPHRGGTKLQLVLYAMAARLVLGRAEAEVDSQYWHLRADAGYRTTGYAVTNEIARSTLEAVALIVHNIERGIFPQHPTETTRQEWISCHYCDPDGMGTGLARRRFVSMSHAPELTDYLVLAEPDLAPPSSLMSASTDDGFHGDG